MLGQTIQHYQLLEAIGAGGMGQIYKAEDTRLHRIVALKLLPPGLAADPERRKRFLQEAQSASALNHPNIVTLFDIVTDGDTQCIVMEYVPGNTLRAVIPPRGLAVAQALQYATQIASALNTAHAAGIIHRDLKPSNIMITPTGMVKILDFGLAKWVGAGPSAEQPTIEQSQLTKEGSIIGTVSYMSPEQAEGKRVDARSDIFSFGSVMYEMVTGRRAFEGTSGISTLSAILRDEVQPIYELAPEVPPLFEQVILRCLPKDPDARWPSMKQIESALITLQRQLDPAGPYAPPLSAASAEIAEAHPAPAPAAPSRAPDPSPVVAAPIPNGAAATKPVPITSPDVRKPSSSSTLVLVLLLVGIVLVASAGAGAWLWWQNQHRPAPPYQAQVMSPPVSTPTTPPAENPPPQDVPRTPPPEAAPAAPVESALKAPRRTAKKSPLPPPTQFTPVPPPAASTPQPKTEEPPAAPPPPKPTPKSAPVVLTPITVNDALPFRIALAQDVPADALEGQSLTFTVVDDFQVGGKILIAKGATVTGVIASEAGKKRFLGIGGGKMRFELQRVEAVDAKKLNVRAMAGRAKEGPTTRPFDTGRGSKSKGLAAVQGAEYIAYIDGDQIVSARK
ncbi:MAG: serine/threonine-protein kinase [Bryobacteraceae bacterium]|jgi:serine/threonine-protein kinase